MSMSDALRVRLLGDPNVSAAFVRVQTMLAEVDYLIEQLATLQERLDLAGKLIGEEWRGDPRALCPECHGDRAVGHLGGCLRDRWFRVMREQ